eukprot:scaffold13249_cov70-Skeletonema_dohrnii-CCMP3373.AAC.2
MFVVDRRGTYVTYKGQMRQALGAGCTKALSGSRGEARKLEKGKRTTNERQKNDRHPKTSFSFCATRYFTFFGGKEAQA